MKKQVRTILGTVIVTVALAGGAHAATETFKLGQPGVKGVTSSHDVLSVSGNETLSLSAYRVGGGARALSTGASLQAAQLGLRNGVGVCGTNCKLTDKNASKVNRNEMLVFDFGTDVSLESITFKGAKNARYKLLAGGNASWNALTSGKVKPQIVNLSHLGGGETLYGIMGLTSGFKIKSIKVNLQRPTVAPVPVPAAGLMLLGGLGALGLARRRKRRTA